MKIVTCNPNGGAFNYILNGVIAAFKAAGDNVSRNTGTMPADFDLYLGCSGWRQAIPPKHNRRGKVGIHVNAFGKKRVGSADGGPIIDEPQSAIKWVVDQKPDFVYCYCSDTFTPEYYNYWTSKYGIPVVGFPTAADITIYKPQKPDPKFKCDIGWVGGNWGYKAKMLNKYLVPLFGRYKCQIFGWGGWNNNKKIADAEVPILFSSAKICPSVSESHTAHHPIDVPERVFKVPASGGFTIHSPSPAHRDMFGDTIPMAQDPKHWMTLIEHYLKDDKARISLAAKQRKLILQKHTYFDRCTNMAKVIGNKDLEHRLSVAKNRFI